MIEYPCCPISAPAIALERKRSLWQDGQRNDIVSRAAHAIAVADRSQIRDLGMPDDLRLPAPPGSLTVVLVESVLHGRELLRRLPSWEFHHRSHAASHGAPRPSQLGASRRAIVSLTAACEDEGSAPDILINAMGGDWIFDIPAYPQRGGIVIDFADDGDDQAAAATRARMRAYLARGWRVDAPAGWNAWSTV